jgi:hypothetical protein
MRNPFRKKPSQEWQRQIEDWFARLGIELID